MDPKEAPRENQASDVPELDDKTRLLLRDKMTGSKVLLYANMIIVVIFIAWAYFSEIDERTQGQGVVIPSSQVQEVENLEGGILRFLFVRAGDEVKKGQVLLQIDDTQFANKFHETKVKYHSLEAKRMRLIAEARGYTELEFPQILKNTYPGVVDHEGALFKIHTENIRSNMATLRGGLKISEKQLAITAPLAKKKIVSQLDLLKLHREINEIKGKISSVKKDYLSKIRGDLVKTNAEMRILDRTLASLEDKKERTMVKSPVDGIIKKINIDTIGGVIKPGEEILQIVPLDKEMLVEAKIAPSKIAFIRAGQLADVKISAYDPSIYGSLKAKVLRISADAIIDKNEQGRQETNYQVIVKTDDNFLHYKGENLPIIPGMQATVSILTGKRTILTYLMKPILKAKQNALRER